MPAETKQDSHLQIGHVLFTDIVGYSNLLSSEQRELLDLLNEIVRNTQEFRVAESAGKLVRVPTGDGMALIFFTNPDAPVHCAREISNRLRQHPKLPLRMGINSGPVDEVTDVNGSRNVTGAGINLAQRVMSCSDAGHILLSKRVADDLAQYGEWTPHLHDLGEIEVKHGVRVAISNLYGNDFGNPEKPEVLKRAEQERALAIQKLARAKRQRLSFIIGAILILGLSLGIATWIWQRRSALTSAYKAGLAGQTEKSIAVLPLENLTEEKENAFFADGIQDELLSNLAKTKDLKVISRTSVMQYKAGITRNLKEIAQQLGVANVVEGSVRRSGNHVRVSVQLIDALNDRHIWQQNYDRTLADSLALQGELAIEIAAGVGATLSPQEKARVEATPTKNIAAYDAYLRGRVFSSGVSWERSNVEGAIRSFREAVKLDPNFVLAWTHLSQKQCDMYWLGFDPTTGRLAAANDALDHALALDPNLPETHLALGYYRYYAQRDFDGALAEFQLAEKSLPNSVDVLRAIGLLQRRLARWDEAITTFRRAVELDPLNIDVSLGLATSCLAVRRFSEVIAVADRILMLDPTNRGALFYKVAAYWAMGDPSAAEPSLANPGAAPEARGVQALLQRRYAAAIEILSKVLSDATDEDRPSLLLELGLSKHRAGDVVGARATYQQAAQYLHRQLENVAPDSFQEAGLHANLGVAYAGLGEAASAIADGERAVAMDPASKDPFEGPEKEQGVATIYALLGDADHAIPILKRLLQTAYGSSSGSPITPGLLRIDPVWDPIRNDPRFQELSAEKNP